MLSAYRPPAAIDQHPVFIGVSGALKEARELDAAGLHHGALLRYLQAAARFAPLRSKEPLPERAVLTEKLRELGVRLSEQRSDSSVGRLFLELAEEDLADPVTPGGPAVAAAIVGDILVATPRDLGFYGKGEGTGNGRYAPRKSAESHDRFRDDLSRMIDLILAGRKSAARKTARPARTGELSRLPALSITKLDGAPLSQASLEGRVVIVEFWATWCPPCRSTLVPALFVFDRRGRLKGSYLGAAPDLHPSLEKKLASLLE